MLPPVRPSIRFDEHLHCAGEATPFDNPAVVQALAWQIGSELVRRHPDEVRLIETHPGGGQYDCVTVVKLVGRGPAFGARIVLDMNMQTGGHLTPVSWHEHGGERLNWLELVLCDDLRRYAIAQIERVEDLKVRRSTPRPTQPGIGPHLIAVFLKRAVMSEVAWRTDNAICDGNYGSDLRRDLLEAFPQVEEAAASFGDQSIDGNPYYRFWFVRPDLRDAPPSPVFVVDTWAGRLWHRGGPEIRLMDAYKRCGSSIDELVSHLCPAVVGGP